MQNTERCKRRIREKRWLEEMGQKGTENKKWAEVEHSYVTACSEFLKYSSKDLRRDQLL